MCHRAVARLPCTAMSVRATRTFVSSQLVAWGVNDDDSAASRVDDITLVIHELAGNVTKFCTKEIEIAAVEAGVLLFASNDYLGLSQLSSLNGRHVNVRHQTPVG